MILQHRLLSVARLLFLFGISWTNPAQAIVYLTTQVEGYGTVRGDGINCGYQGTGTGCKTWFDDGPPSDTATLTAYPEPGYKLIGWGGYCVGATGNTCTVFMNLSRTVTASFTAPPPPPKLTVSKTGQGTITSFPTGIDCGMDCSEQYALNTTVTLTAVPVRGFTFTGWSGACSGMGTCTVYMSASKSVFATFTPDARYSLTVTKTGQPGTVTSSPAGIDCGTDCNEIYDNFTPVTLTAKPAGDGVFFTGWSGACSGWASSCTLDMSANIRVTATFGPPLAGWPRFAQPVSYASLFGSFSLAVGDLNGDGKPDLATASYDGSFHAADNDVSVLLNNGTGGFHSTIYYDGGYKPPSVAIGDVNLDGKPDLVLPSKDMGQATMLLGQGNGAFDKSPYTIDGPGWDALIRDLNGDSKPDLVETVGYHGGIQVCLNDGTGPFNCERYSSGDGTYSRQVAIGDLNGDRKPDIATATDIGIYVLMNDGTGVFKAPYAVSPSTSSYDLVIGDINGDGKPDLAYTNTVAGVNVVSVLANDGKGTLLAVGDFAVSGGPLALGDLNRDGRPDLVTAGQSISVLLNEGAATFQPAIDYPVGNDPYDIAIADLNGDGTPDLALVNHDAASVTVLLNTTPAPLPSYPLTVTKSGQGTVRSTPAGIDCGTDCSQHYTQGTKVTLTATPAAGFTFRSWSGACMGAATTCQVTLQSAKTVTATFLRLYQLTVTTSGLGTVTSVPAGINCGTDCSEKYAQGTTVEMTATPAEGYTFTGWGGACTGTGTCQVTLTANKSVTATFTPVPRYPLSVTVTGQGTVTSTPAGINCGTDCNEAYAQGTNVALTAIPAAGYTFSKWSGACTGTGACQVTMAADQIVGAIFFRPTFSLKQAVTYAAGSGPQGIAMGDLNGDGQVDLAVAAVDSNSVGVLFNGGNGIFQAPHSYAAGAGARAVAIGDVNRDGKPDLVVANADDGTVSVLLASGGGSFKPAVPYTAGVSPQAVVIDDLNADAKPDLIVPRGNGGKVSILLGLGTGAFKTAVQYAAGTMPQAVAAGDLNGDGKVDLVAANAGSAEVRVLLGKGTGAFQAGVRYAVGSTPEAVAIGDLNGDGKKDLAVANAGSANASVLLGKGDGTFNPAVHYAVGATPRSVSLSDFNGDGKLDLAVANAGGGNVSVLLGQGNGTFKLASRYAVGISPGALAVGDITGDGKPDLAMADADSDNVSVLVNSSRYEHSGTFPVAVEYAVGRWPDALVAGDLNRDGKIDLITANVDSYNVSVLLGQPGGTFKTAVKYLIGQAPSDLAIADLNRDGYLDLITAEYPGSTDGTNVSVLLGRGDGTFTPAVHYIAGATGPYSHYSVAVGDLNRDGKLDLVTSDFWQDSVYVLLGLGNGAFQPAIKTGDDADGTEAVAIGDLNGDGKQDLARIGFTVGILTGRGNGNLNSATYYPTGTSYPSESVAIGDLNKDGKLDLATTNGYGGVTLLLNQDNGIFKASLPYSVDNTPHSVAIGDLNRDGKPDLITANTDGNNISVLLGRGTGSFQADLDYAVGAAPRRVILVDLNGDGKLDVVTANSKGNNVSVLLNH